MIHRDELPAVAALIVRSAQVITNLRRCVDILDPPPAVGQINQDLFALELDLRRLTRLVQESLVETRRAARPAARPRRTVRPPVPLSTEIDHDLVVARFDSEGRPHTERPSAAPALSGIWHSTGTQRRRGPCGATSLRTGDAAAEGRVAPVPRDGPRQTHEVPLVSE